MTRAGVVRPGLMKEVRGLLPLWAACASALIAAGVRHRGLVLDAAAVAYIIGPLAIGAHAVGQEYSYRTLPLLLAQPVDRRRIYRLKFAVVTIMILTIAVLALATLGDGVPPNSMWTRTGVQILPVLGGLFVAPWLTMLTGSAIAGILFAASVASATYIAAVAAAALWFDVGPQAAQTMILGPWAAAMIGFCAVAAPLGLRRFFHLEAIDGGGRPIHLPRWRTSAAGTRTHRPFRALAAKELRLQQLTFVLAGVFAPTSLVLAWLQRAIPAWSDAPTAVLTLLYCLSLAILAGSLASAEERQQGTLPWQLLQPIPAWQQWAVKSGVAMALSIAFAAVLPSVLLHISRGADSLRVTGDFVIAAALLTAASLYLSSISSSGVRAMVLTLPAGVGTALFFQAAERVLRQLPFPKPIAGQPAHAIDLAAWVLAGTTLPFLTWFAFVNHRSAGRSFWRIARQVALLAAAAAAAIVVRRTFE